MRVKVIPNRPLSLRQPIAWGVAIGLPIGTALNRFDTYIAAYVAIGVAALIASIFAPVTLYVLIDALFWRRLKRLAIRGAVFGITYSVSMYWLVGFESAEMVMRLFAEPVRSTTDTISLLGFAAAALAAGLAIVWIVNRIARTLMIQNGDLCWTCGYDRRGLADDAVCPECGQPQGTAPRPRLLTTRRALFALVATAAIVFLAINLARSAIWHAPAIARFAFWIPDGSDTSYAQMWSESAGWVVHDSGPHMVAFSLDITEHARALGTAADTLVITRSLDRSNEDLPALQLRLRSSGNLGPKNMTRVMTWNADEQTARRLMAAPITDEHIRALLRSAQTNGWAVSANPADFESEPPVILELDW